MSTKCRKVGNLINGSIRPQKEIADPSCIFLSGNTKKVCPVELGGDTNEYDESLGEFTFTRTKVEKGMTKGRAEMNFCFVETLSPQIVGMNPYQMAYLAYIKMINDYCENAVHNTSRDTRGKYGAELYIPKRVL